VERICLRGLHKTSRAAEISPALAVFDYRFGARMAQKPLPYLAGLAAEPVALKKGFPVNRLNGGRSCFPGTPAKASR